MGEGSARAGVEPARGPIPGAIEVLNPQSTAPAAEPAALSRQLVEHARAISSPEECAALEGLAGALHAIEPAEIEGDAARTAFWVNIYNALVRHELWRNPREGSLLRHRRLFRRVAYQVGARDYSPDVIEHGLLRRNARPAYALRRVMRSSDRRAAAMVSRLDPRIHFALNCGALSCPPIAGYSAAAIDEELELATRSYIRAETSIDRDRREVTLPRLLRLYRPDFGPAGSRLRFVTARLMPDDAEWLRGNRDRISIDYGDYDWTISLAG